MAENKEGKGKVRLEIPSHPRYVSVARDLIYQLGRKAGFSAGGAFDLKIVTGEAVINIIRHAYAGRTDKVIHLQFEAFEKYVEVQYRDYGIQSKIGSGKAMDLSDYREKGLGLYLISNLTDYHFYDQSMNTGTLLVIKKRIG